MCNLRNVFYLCNDLRLFMLLWSLCVADYLCSEEICYRNIIH